MIVVAGEALVDRLVRPDGGVTEALGGSPYTTARAIGRLGVAVAFLGALSTDERGQRLEAALAADGVSLDLVQRTNAPTTTATATLDPAGVASYTFAIGGTSAPALLPRPLAAGLPAGTRALHTGSLGLVLEPMASTIEALVAGLDPDVLLSVDPNCRPAVTADPDAYRARLTRVLRRADIVKVSADDLAFMYPGLPVGTAASRVASLGPRAVLVTDGPHPVRVLVDGTATLVQAPPVEVVDTVGAGDTFGGATLASLVAAGLTRADLEPGALLAAAAFAARAAALSCTRAGAAPPTLAELGGWPTR